MNLVASAKRDTGLTPPRRCWAEVDLSLLANNVQLIRDYLPPNIGYIAVVKADAYGHGLEQVVPHLLTAGVDAFAVASPQEGITVREVAGPACPILTLSPILPEEAPIAFQYNLTVTLSSETELQSWTQLAQKYQQPLQTHLAIDTGMGREGIWYPDTPPLWAKIQSSPLIQITGIYTHFSSADVSLPKTALQRQRFLDTLKALNINPQANNDLIIHAHNSAGLAALDSISPFNAIRVGLVQLGILPGARQLPALSDLKPVMSLKSRVGLIKDLPSGTPISYGDLITLDRPSKVAIVTAGYGDGIPYDFKDGGYALIHGHRCPVLGKVTMDQTILDITDLPPTPPVSPGDPVTWIGSDGDESISIQTFSSLANTIEWDAYCSITKRVTRHYLHAPRAP